jgi:cell division protease FtsH
MCALIGGRVAEEIVNGEPATGALNDLERMTGMAYSMVQYYGMSDKVGQLSFYDSTGARGYDLTKPYSEKTAELMDQEVRKLVDEIHDRTWKILTDNREGFEQMAALLLEKEVIFADDIEKILGPKVKPPEDGGPYGGSTSGEAVNGEDRSGAASGDGNVDGMMN